MSYDRDRAVHLFGRRIQSKKPIAMALCAFAVATVVAMAPLHVASAVSSPRISQEEKEQLFKRHEVSDTVSPRGVRVDVYDYWITSQTDRDDANPNGFKNMGINNPQGQEAYLKFGKDMVGTGINAWTGSAKTNEGIVMNRLGEDGYPHVAPGKIYDTSIQVLRTQEQSLKYLFDGSSYEGKKAHVGAAGLLQLDGDGYYYYNSKQNFASYNAEKNAFVLYDSPAVQPGGADKQSGQFFPFNPPKNVYPGTETNGKLDSHILSTNSLLNHYFGLQLSASFMQPMGGVTKNGEQMVFQFTGDDDVWVFIDGVLVGDVGGIHDRTGLSINFATGEVYTYNGSSNGSEDTHYTDTTIRAMFQKAQGDEFDQDGFKGDTFKDGTYHTLQFFYLERGNGNSNMALKFNLVSVPESTMTKVDQMGKPVEGAVFDLYATDDTYAVAEGTDPIATGRTDAAGRFTFVLPDGNPLSFMKMYAEKGYQHYLLHEREVPAGHRPSPDGKLKYVISKVDPTLGFVFSDNYWDSGVYAHAEQVIGIEGDTVKGFAAPGENPAEYTVGDGAVFAVIYRKLPSDDGSNYWHSLSGDTYHGWRASESPVTSVEQLRDAQVYTFTDDDKDGAYSLDIKDMPGNPEHYYLMSGDADAAAYTVGFYYTTATKDGKVARESITAQNTHRLPGSQFKRQTAANLYVTDIANVFAVQKVDERDRAVNGAEFSLFRAQDMEGGSSGLHPKPGATALQKATTKTADKDDPVQGEGVCFMGPLDPGIYYLVETKAPAGYVVTPTATRVLVDARGVHVDAGTKDDGVAAMVSIGSLVDSMSQFAADDDIDMTFFDILASCDTASSDDVRVNQDGTFSIGWNKDTNPNDDLWLTYGAAQKVLDYGADNNRPSTGQGDENLISYITQEGLAMCRVRQNRAYGAGEDAGFIRRYGTADWTDLGEKDLTSLYTGATLVVVENKRQPDLTITKHARIAPGLVGPTFEGDAGDVHSALWYKQFWMRLTLLDASGAPLDGAYEASIWENVDGVPNCVHTFDALKSGDEFYLHDGQSLEVYGLPKGAAYQVEEIAFDEKGTNGTDEDIVLANPLGFVQMAAENVKGEIGAAGAKASFTNEYQASAMLQIPVAKQFDRWDLVKEGFEFKLMGTLGAPMPEDAMADGVATVVLPAPAFAHDGLAAAQQANGAFGPITFHKTGTFTYYIMETRPTNPLAGVTYSDALYRVVVHVTDAGKGELELAVTVEKLVDDQGGHLTGAPDLLSQGNLPLFINTFDAERTGYAPSARKEYVDYSGTRPLVDGMFEFTVQVPAEAPVPSDTGEPAVAGPDGATFTIANKGTAIAARQAWFTSDQVGKTYEYTFFENRPQEATHENGYTCAGITYDPTVYKAFVTVGAGDGETGTKVKVDVAYKKQLDDGSWQNVDEAVFHNECHAVPAEATLSGTKVLRGRNVLNGESFTFSLVPADETTVAAIQDGSISVSLDGSAAAGAGDNWQLQATVESLLREPDAAPVYKGEFAFAPLTFSRVGVYLFAINEVVPPADAAKPGMTYDAHSAFVKVTVEADGSDTTGGPRLKASVEYDNGSSSTDAGQAVFTNVYQSVCTSDGLGLTVKKTLDGRDMHADEFMFEIAGAPGDGSEQDALAAQEKLLNATDREFGNPRPTDGVSIMKGKLEDLLFTQDDAGRTFAYRIRERVPDGYDGASVLGVTYDRTEYEYRLTPIDGGDGSLALKAELYKVRETDGSDCKTLLYSHDPAEGSPEAGDDVRVAAFANSYAPAPVTLTDEWCTLTKHLTGRPWHEGDAFDFVMERVSFQADGDDEVQTHGAAFDAMPLPAAAKVTDASQMYVDNDGVTVEGVRQFGFEPLTFSAPGTCVYRVREVEPSEGLDGILYSKREVAVTVAVEDPGAGRLVAYVEIEPAPDGERAHFTNVYSAGGGVTPPVDPEEPTDPEKPTDPEEPTDPEKPVDPEVPTDPEGPTNPDDPGIPGEPGDSNHGAGGGTVSGKPGLPGTGDSAMVAVLVAGALGVAGIAAGIYLALRGRNRR